MMKGTSILLLAALSTLAFPAFSKTTTIDFSGAKFSGVQLDQLKDGTLELEASLASIQLKDVTLAGRNYVAIESTELAKTFKEGSPNLPVFSKLIEVPVGAELSYEVVSQDEQVVELSSYGIHSQIVPAQPSASKSADLSQLKTFFNAGDYARNAFLPNKLVKIEDLGILRSVRLARVTVSPFEYNAVSNTLKVKNDVVVRIHFKNSNDKAQQRLTNRYSSAIFNDVLTQTVPNLRFVPFARETPTFVIVTPKKFEATLQAFIDFKRSQDYNVVVAFTEDIGNTTTAIKTYLTNLYNKPLEGFLPHHYVLFVGDVAEVPAFKGTTGSHVTDFPYCEYTGDALPDALYGRFSASTVEELKNIVDKTIAYQTRSMPDSSYLSRALMVAGADSSHQMTWGNGQIRYGVNNYFNADNGINIIQLLQPDTKREYSARIKSEINKGLGFANYTAHCSSAGWADPSFVKSDLNSLTNEGKFGVWIGNCCQSSKFEEPAAFGEAVLRMKNKGAAAYIGTSNLSYWDEDYWWGVGFKPVVANPVYDEKRIGAYDRMFRMDYNKASQMILAGNMAVEESTSSRKKYYWEIYNLMGDPSLTVQLK